MKKKSIGINAILNAIRNICGIIFPLITFPYVSRILHVENLGIYNFCKSIISYFTLLAGLGVSTYAVREGARYRSDKEKMSEFSSEVFSINMISTVISYIILAICIVLVSRLRNDAQILIILSLNIFFTTVGCEWIFTVYEDFGFITIRGIVFQFISLILMFIFVKTENDLIPYAIITVVASSGANIVNAIVSRKYCKIRFVIDKKMGRMLVPILVLFANSVATNIYTSSDTTMLGIFAGNRATGLYSVSTKIYEIVKSLLAAVILVSIPRLSAYLGEKDYKNFNKTSNQILNALIVVAVPAMVGIFSLSKNIILIISGKEYIEATESLQILSIALLFSLFSWFYTSCILIPYREEKKVLGATIAAATINICLNFVLIPMWKQNAAAFTTVIAEFTSMMICFYYGRKLFTAKVAFKDILSVIIGCIGIAIVCVLCEKYITSLLLSTIVAVAGSIVVYGILLVLMKNQSIEFILDTIRAKIKH